MTHDELLAKVELTLGTYISKYYGSKKDVELRSDVIDSLQALRAVVELHKPKEEDGKLWCEHEVCYNHIEFLERDDCDCSYPCPTIQKIMDQLK